MVAAAGNIRIACSVFRPYNFTEHATRTKNQNMNRTASISRKTNETEISISINLDGTGKNEITTGIGFLDHMLTHIAVHGLFDLTVKAVGDLHVDEHHTVEDVAIVLGQAFAEALGDKKGIVRTAHAYVPMDEALAFVALDLSGRPYTVIQVESIGDTRGLRLHPRLRVAYRMLCLGGADGLKRCAGEVKADYTLQPTGSISVLNRCKLANGGQIQGEGVVRVAGKGQPNSVLKVRFAPAFLSFIPQVWGDYQIIALSPDYAHALVGDPSREYLWILSRSPRMDDASYERLVEEARAQGFETGKLVKTRQDGP